MYADNQVIYTMSITYLHNMVHFFNNINILRKNEIYTIGNSNMKNKWPNRISLYDSLYRVYTQPALPLQNHRMTAGLV